MSELLADCAKHQTTVRVRYAETDQMGVVYYANYFVWMEIGRVEMLRARGFNYKDLEQSEGLYLSVVDAKCRYVYPARYDDEVRIQTEIVKASSRVLDFAYEMRSTTADRVVAEGSSRHIWLNHEWKLCRLPERYRAIFGRSG